MKSSRFGHMIYAFLMGCGLSTLSLPSQAQSYGGGDALPPPLIAPGHTVTPNGNPLPARSKRHASTPSVISQAETSNDSSGNAPQDGASRLRSAYDRASNPAYYEMLDQLERNQKKRKARPSIAPLASPSSLDESSSYPRAHTKKYKKYRAKKTAYRSHKKHKASRTKRTSYSTFAKHKVKRKKTHARATKTRYRQRRSSHR